MSISPLHAASDFPILGRQVHGKRLVYLDNAATSQKPAAVIDAISNYYREHNANVHRGIHMLGDESTKLLHTSRQTIANFFGAKPTEFIATRNTTEAVNQVAQTWGRAHIQAGDVIISTEMEHHSNFVPWQRLAREKSALLECIPVTPDGLLDLQVLRELLERYRERVKLVTFVHISNAIGTLNPVVEIVETVRAAEKLCHGQIAILVDGAQAAPHIPVNFADLDADFYVVSAHKMLGPMGIGGLFVRERLLKDLEPWLVGGGMIAEVALTKTTYMDDLEERFMAGTPDVVSTVGWAAACEYLSQIGMTKAAQHDQQLVAYALEKLRALPELQLVGPTDAAQRAGSVAFLYRGVHAHDVGQIVDSEGVAVRTGHHCTMPLHTKFDWPATVRVSFQLYNSSEDVDALVSALAKVKKVFGK